MSDSPGLVDFAIGLVNSVINLPDGQVKFFEEFKLQKNCEINLLIKTFFGLVEMIFGLVNVSFSLPEWQAVKMTFFAPCLPPHQYTAICTMNVVPIEKGCSLSSLPLSVRNASVHSWYATTKTFTSKRMVVQVKWFAHTWPFKGFASWPP